MTKTISFELDPADVKDAIRGRTSTFPRLPYCWRTLITDPAAASSLYPTQETFTGGQEASVRVHLDGARVFNAALALGVEQENSRVCRFRPVLPV